MEGYLLTILGDGIAGPVVPRRAQLTLHPGTGRLLLPSAPPTDATWQASVQNAWRAALRLTGRADVDARVEIAASAPLTGASGGLPLGLLALAALLDVALPAHFATGGVRDREGFLAGGMAAPAKSAAAAQLAPQLGMRDPAFLAPPIVDLPSAQGMRVHVAADLASAFARLAPKAYRSIADAHRRIRAGGPPGRFAVIRRLAGPATLPAAVEGIAVRETQGGAPPEGVVLDLGEDGLLLWRADVPPDFPLEKGISMLWALAKAASHRA